MALMVIFALTVADDRVLSAISEPTTINLGSSIMHKYFTCSLNIFRKDEGHPTIDNNSCPASSGMQMHGLPESMFEGQSSDLQRTGAKTQDYTSLDHKVAQNNHVYEVIST